MNHIEAIKADVAVIGGLAGCAAAIATARYGARDGARRKLGDSRQSDDAGATTKQLTFS